MTSDENMDKFRKQYIVNSWDGVHIYLSLDLH